MTTTKKAKKVRKVKGWMIVDSSRKSIVMTSENSWNFSYVFYRTKSEATASFIH